MERDRVPEREQMVRTQIEARGIADQRVLNAMRMVPRHLFVPQSYEREAYNDYPLPIGNGQTISQPYIVALMTGLVHPGPGVRVLEIGTGSGYQAAILTACGSEVTSIERLEPVAELARKNLMRAGIQGVRIITGDGSEGFPQEGPYHGILITAAAPEIPRVLLDQLAENGRIVAPVGDRDIQILVRITKKKTETFTEHFGAVRFVPLIGTFGWNDEKEW